MSDFAYLLTTMRERYDIADDECGAAWPLNRHGRIASAAEPWVAVRPCLSREFVWSPLDQAMICAVYWTPRKRGLS